jgi:uncharacterized membrane protein
MEYVSGGSIGACLRKQGKLGVSVVKSFTAQILAGLEYLHAKDILHRVRNREPSASHDSDCGSGFKGR